MRISFDTNILVYAGDLDAGEKHQIAFDLIARAAEADCVLTLQSLAEFYHAATRRRRMPIDEAEALVAGWREAFQVTAADESDLETAMRTVREHGLSFWDAMLCATVRQAGCRILFSEDLQDGRRLSDLTIVNPFRPTNQRLVEEALRPSSSH